MELRRERDDLLIERADLEDLLGSETLQWKRIAAELKEVRARFGKDAPGGARRTALAEAGETPEISAEDMIEREPVTVICSKMGWIRALKGHLAADAEVKFKDGDEGRFRRAVGALPDAELAARLVQHDMPDVTDHPGFLGKGDEAFGRQQPHGMQSRGIADKLMIFFGFWIGIHPNQTTTTRVAAEAGITGNEGKRESGITGNTACPLQ
jgi:hypothetical protein